MIAETEEKTTEVEMLPMLRLRKELETICHQWSYDGLPSREILLETAARIRKRKDQNNVAGIWSDAPLIVTATLDDGIGQGIEIINIYSEIVGLKVKPLGLLQPPGKIIAACRKEQPDLLGLTMLQIDSEEALALIGKGVPPQTRIVAGGPAFRYESDMAARCGVHFVAANVAAYVAFLLNWDR